LHSYRKNWDYIGSAAQQFCFEWREPDQEESLDLVVALTRIAGEHGLRLTVCSQAMFVVCGAEPAACIDAARLSYFYRPSVARANKRKSSLTASVMRHGIRGLRQMRLLLRGLWVGHRES
tara:strand:- start:1901 stop:2260 length:360 start_codon:yes stop_codon:yes gene_type:complete